MTLDAPQRQEALIVRDPALDSTFVTGRLVALDGLRTPAVIAVFFYHSASGMMKGGWSGVDTFFALSGFVITLLLVREFRERGRIRLGRFYLQRLARLWPALLIVCFCVGLTSVLLPGSGWGAQGGNSLQAATYLMNIYRSGLLGVTTAGGALGHTWTLAVEEQFYLLWPLVLIVLLRTVGERAAMIVTVALAGATVVERAIMVASDVGLNRLYNGPDTRADQLLVGCALALLLSTTSSTSTSGHRVAAISRWLIWPSSILLVLVAFLLPPAFEEGGWFNFYWVMGPFLLALIATCLICGLVTNPNHVLSRALSHRILSWPGRNLSYGFYLWHLPLIYLLIPLIDSIFLRVPIVFLLTLVVAYLSARFIEAPVRTWVRKRMARRIGDGRAIDKV